LRKAIHCFKYEDLHCLAGPLGALMASGWQTLAGNRVDIDLILPVPLHRARLRERGYNQAALLARELGNRIGVPVAGDLLVRTRATVPQVGLSAEERQANVQGAFQSVTGVLVGKKVLLVDDVYTTGSTLESACAALRESGAVSVWAYTLVRAR
jgi:ComF family protein